jgi:Restriction endonuclease
LLAQCEATDLSGDGRRCYSCGMPAETHYEKQLAELNREIEQLEADVNRLDDERRAIRKQARRSTRRSRYVSVIRSLRAPTARFNLWPWAVLSAGPLVVGALSLIAVNLVTGSYPLAFFAFLLGVVAGVGLFATMMYHPPDTLLPSAMAEAEAQARLDDARLEEKLGRITETKQQLERLMEVRRERIASGQVQRAALLQRDWKKMAASEWEDFVVEVGRTLGASVERARRLDDEGANLIIIFGPRRVAVKTLVARETIPGTAVQKVLADKAALGCDSAAIITSGRFTGAAQDYASRNECTLVDREAFPDFVLGKIEV